MSGDSKGYYVILFLLAVLWFVGGMALSGLAHRKGRSGFVGFLIPALVGFFGYFFWDFFFQSAAKRGQENAAHVASFLVSGVISLIIGGIVIGLQSRDEAELQRRGVASGEYRKCPQCAELIKSDAIKCRFCGATNLGTEKA